MTTFTVPRMICKHCCGMIERSVRSIDPTATIVCDLTRRSVRIASILNVHALATAIHEAGFEAEVT